MKLLFSYYLPSGGMETLYRIRAEALMQRGVECHLHYQQSGSGMQNISRIQTWITNNDQKLFELVHKERFDAVIVSSNFWMVERVRGWNYKGPVIYEVQGLGQKERAAEELSEAVPYLNAYCTAALYPRTRHLMELFEQKFPFLPKFCFPNFIDTGCFSYRKHNPVSYPIIGWVGRIERNKNWRAFLQIGSILRKAIPNLQLWMFEDAALFEPDEKAAFDSIVNSTGLSGYLTRFSNVPHKQMPDYFSTIGDSGGFVLSTSITEGFGYAVAEAMSCRCPVISTDSDGVRSFIKHNSTGKFYSDTSNAFTQAMELMFDMPLREKIRNMGMEHIHRNFTTQVYCDNFLRMLQSLGVR